MGAPERRPPDDPREWLNRAKSNLALAKSLVPEAYLEDLCFEAQQAAEKAIKAVLMRRGHRVPVRPQPRSAVVLARRSGEAVPETISTAAELTQYAVTTRYPHLEQPVDEREYAEAVNVAEAVVCWAAKMV